MIFNPVSLLLWGFLIIITGIAALLYYYRGTGIENQEDKIVMFGFTGLLIGIALNRLFAYMTHFNVPGDYIDHTFYGDYGNPYPFFLTLLNLGFISLGMGYSAFIYGFEYKFKKSKYILTLTGLALNILVVLISPLRIVSTIYFQTISIVILLMFARWSNLESKTIYYILLFGFALFGIALVLDTGDVKDLNVIPLFLSPLLYIGAICTIILPIKINPKHFRNSIKYLFFSGTLIILTMTFIITYIFFIAIPISLSIIVLNFLLLSVILFIYSIKDLRSQMNIESLTKTHDFLSVFKRPDKITQEAVEKIAELRYFYIILKTGLTIYARPLEGEPTEEQESKDLLFGGALTAIETFLKEMYESKTVLKEVKQEHVSILIEEGEYVRIAVLASHDQKDLRKKMQNFLKIFEKEYKEPLKREIPDTRQFESVSVLIEKIFKGKEG